MSNFSELFVPLIALCLIPIQGQANFYHTVIGAHDDSLLKGRQDQAVSHRLLTDGDVLVASTFNGNHGDVACAGRSFANLTQLTSEGRVRWSQTYDQLPVDTLFALPRRAGGYRLFLSHRHCHERNGVQSPDFEIWNVAENGELAEQVLIEKETSLLRWVFLPDARTAVIVHTADTSYELRIFDGDEVVARKPLPVGKGIRGFTQTARKLVVLTQSNDMLYVDKRTLEIDEVPLEFRATQVAGETDGDRLFLVKSPQYQMPSLAIAEVLDGEITEVYRGVHSLRVVDATVAPDGRLWLVGENETFGAYLIFVDGEVTESRTFPSVLPVARLSSVTHGQDRVVLVGTTYMPGAFGSPDTDAVIVSFSNSSEDDLRQFDVWDACALDTDRYQRVVSELEERLLIFPRLQLRPHRDRGFDIPFEHGVPVSAPQCDVKGQHAAMAFLDALLSNSGVFDIAEHKGFRIELRFSQDEPVVVLTPMGTTPTRFAMQTESPDELWRYVANEIYPSVPRYVLARQALRREAGILPNLEKVAPGRFAETAQLYQDFLNDWNRFTQSQQRNVHAIGAYHTIHLTEERRIRILVNQYFTTLYVPFDQRNRAVETLIEEASEIARYIPILEAKFWEATGVRISMGRTSDHNDYITVLRRLLGNRDLQNQIKRVLRGRVIEIVAHGVNEEYPDIDMFASRVQMPLAKIADLPAFLSAFNADEQIETWASPSPERLMGIAIQYNWSGPFERAIKLGADVLDPCFRGQSPIHQAAKQRRPDFVERLLDLGVAPDVRNANQETALHLAIEKRNLIAADLLLTAGADPNLLNHENETALDIAERRSRSTPRWLIARLQTEGGKRGKGRRAASYTMPSHDGCEPGSGVPQIIFQ